MKWLVGLFAVLAVLCLYGFSGYTNQYDDSYITYRYAINLAQDHGLVFNVGERTDAASSFLWTLVLATAYVAGLHNLEMVSFALNMFSVGSIAVFLCLAAGNLWLGIPLGLLASCHGFISGWAVLGMDTVPFAALLVAWAYFTFFQRNDALSMILTILVVLMRFEGLFILPFWYMATGRDLKRSCIVLGATLAFYALKFAYYGTLLPHSFYIKQLLPYYHPNPVAVANFWKHFALIAPLGAVAGFAFTRKYLWLGVYVMFSAASCLFGPYSDWSRYTVHLLPLMLLLAIPALKYRWYVAAPLLLVLAWQSYGSVQFMRFQAQRLAPAQEMRRQAGEWLNAHASGSVWVLSGDLGMIGYTAKNYKFIDTVGLTSVDVLREKQQGRDASAVIARKRPAYIADTFKIEKEQVVYREANVGFSVLAGMRYSDNIAIAVAAVQP